MSIKLGSTALNKAFLGSTEIKKMYLGSTVVFDKTGFDLTAFVDTGSDGAHWAPELSDLFTDDGTTAAGDTDNVKQINDLSSFGRDLTTLNDSSRGTYDATNRRIGLDGVDDFYFHETSIAWPGGPYIAWVSFTTLDVIETGFRGFVSREIGETSIFKNNFVLDGNDDGSVRVLFGNTISANSLVFSPGDTVNLVIAHDGTDGAVYFNSTLVDTQTDNPTRSPYAMVIGAETETGEDTSDNSRLQFYNAGYRIGSWTTAQRDDLIAHLAAQGYGS